MYGARGDNEGRRRPIPRPAASRARAPPIMQRTNGRPRSSRCCSPTPHPARVRAARRAPYFTSLRSVSFAFAYSSSEIGTTETSSKT